MSDNDFVAAAKREEAYLLAELDHVPAYRKLVQVRALIDTYTGNTETGRIVTTKPTVVAPKRRPPPRQRSTKTIFMENAAVTYLKDIGRRATSGQIAEAIGKDKIGGKTPNKTLASFLSNSKTFDNVPNEGYGLAEWGGKIPGKRQADLALPDHSNVGASDVAN